MTICALKLVPKSLAFESRGARAIISADIIGTPHMGEHEGK